MWQAAGELKLYKKQQVEWFSLFEGINVHADIIPLRLCLLRGFHWGLKILQNAFVVSQYMSNRHVTYINRFSLKVVNKNLFGILLQNEN